LASAWQQVDGVRQANDLLRQAQLARAALQQIYRRQLQPLQPETIVTLTAPLHSKLMASSRTILAAVRSRRVPERVFSGAFRSATRLRRRRGVLPKTRPALLNRINSGEVTVLSPPKPPSGLVSLEQLSKKVAPGLLQTLAKKLLQKAKPTSELT